MDEREFYHGEWKLAEENGNEIYSAACKEKYRELVMLSILKPYHFYIEKLKRFETINLN